MSENSQKHDAFRMIRQAIESARGLAADGVFFSGRYSPLNLNADLKSRYDKVHATLNMLSDDLVKAMSVTDIKDLERRCAEYMIAIENMHALRKEQIDNNEKEVYACVDQFRTTLDNIISFSVILSVYQLMTVDGAFNTNVIVDIAKGGQQLRTEFQNLLTDINERQTELTYAKAEIDKVTESISTQFGMQTTRNKDIQKLSLLAMGILGIVLSVMLVVYYCDINEDKWYNTSYAVSISVHKALTVGLLVSAIFTAYRLFKNATHNIEVNEHRIALFASLRAARGVIGSSAEHIVVEKFIDQIVLQDGFRHDGEANHEKLFRTILEIVAKKG